MKDDHVFAAMIKGREACRMVLQSHEMMRAGGNSSGTTAGVGYSRLLSSANRAASQMLEHLRALSGEMSKLTNSEADRQYASKLVLEIKEMLEKAMIMEREMRRLISADFMGGSLNGNNGRERCKSISA